MSEVSLYLGDLLLGLGVHELDLHRLLAQHARRNLFVKQQLMVVYYNRS
jgi:hypothetical protein